jgi:hypothetical protein
VALVNEVYWPDAIVRDLVVDYDAVRISLDCVDNVTRRITAIGYIALSVVPLWDEMVVAQCGLSTDSQLQHSALARLNESGILRHDSGSLARNQRTFQTLTLVLADGSEVVVAAHDFYVDEQE